ncbi:hypothetical protein AXF42_Ash007399 [Apostasia shenzhenica]|uniref:Uncharacterized protein n=1 Tax=Apostasia shenzhenica TaxID=1088818 RepID=A0A2I0BA25_9ASPA|nr:hypothetical protein AXF42_Ash007399 [Apostasia shenzhenica]
MATAASGHLLPSLVPLLFLLFLSIVSGDVVDDSRRQVIPHAYSSNFAQILGNLAVAKHNKGSEKRLDFCRTVMAEKVDNSTGTSGEYAIELFASPPGPDQKQQSFSATADVRGVINADGSVFVSEFVLLRFSRERFPRLVAKLKCYRI